MVAILGIVMGLGAGESQAEKYHTYIGTYTRGDSKGIYMFEFDSVSGETGEARLVAEAADPSFLSVNAEGTAVYAVLETGEWDGMENSGGIAAFSRDPESGNLTHLNSLPSYGAHPCHLELHPDASHVFFANYSGGSIGAYEVKEDHSLGALTGFVQHTGGSIHRGRQKSPHGHAIHLSPDRKVLMSADLGVDCLWMHTFDPEFGTIGTHPSHSRPMRPGSGPRHFAFHPTNNLVMVLNEMSSQLTSFRYNRKSGNLSFINQVSTLPEDFESRSSTAEVVIHPNGKFVYASNRGHDSIAHFTIDNRGSLKRQSITKTGGKTPRNFNVDPTGKWLVAASQNSGFVTFFQIDPATGNLSPFGKPLNVPHPVCVRFVKAAE